MGKMRLGIIGRTGWLLQSAYRLQEAGHEIACVVTARAAPDYDVTENDFAELAEKAGCPFLVTGRINGSKALGWLRECGPIDVAVSVNYPGLIGREVIDLFPLGILNAHGGDLPRYRGNACQAWAIVRGEERIGLCVHKMVAGELDSGPIVSRAYLPLSEDTRIGEVYAWMGREIPELMAEGVRNLEADSAYVLEVQSADPSQALRCYPRLPEDGRIDWGRPCQEVLRLVNASSEPYGGAFADLDGERVTVWRARLPRMQQEEKWAAVPGQVAAVDREAGWVEVFCGDGKLRLEDLEYRGERGPASVMIRSLRTRFR